MIFKKYRVYFYWYICNLITAMRRVFILALVLNSFLVRSQILNDSVVPNNCYGDGAIFLDVVSVSQIGNWFYNDDLLGWVNVSTINDIQLSLDSDTLITQNCGSFKVVVAGDTSFYYISCPLGSRGSHSNVKCFGDSTGFLKRVAHSGSPPYFYEWFKDSLFFSSGINDTIFDDLSVGFYKIVFTDSIGCKDSVLTNIISPTELFFDTFHINNINCRGVNSGNLVCSPQGGKKFVVGEFYDVYLVNLTTDDTVSFITRDSISANISFQYNPYEITLDSLYAANYKLTVIDTFGCFLNNNFDLSEPEPYQTYASTTFPLICESDSGYLMIDSIVGGGNINFGFNYDISTGPFADSLHVPSGWYNIYIEDLDFGCIDTVPVRCYAQYEIDVFSTISMVSCFGNNSGSVIIDSIIGGNEPYDVQWGGFDNLFLSAGTYDVNVVDSIGCVHEESFTINQSNQIIVDAVIQPSSCHGQSDGVITIEVYGGVGPLSYFWLNGTGTADSLYSLADGVYSLVVSDSLLCFDTFSFVLESPELLDININAEDTSLVCYDALTLIDLNILGGTSPYNITWSTGDTSLQIVVGSGAYQVQVTDNNGCFASQSITISQPDSLSLLIESVDMTCNQGGVATALVDGGTSPISFLWNTGDTTASIDSLFDLVYWVLVTDSCGASYVDTVFLEPYILEAEVIYDDLIHKAEVQIVESSSTGPFDYFWINIFGDTIGNNNSSPVLCEGTYFIKTYDISNDCYTTDTLLVEFDLPNGIIDINNTTVFDDSELWDLGPYTYFWSNGEITQHANICPGNHWVEVTDYFGCLVRQDFTIDDLLITLDPANSIIECNLENLDIQLEASAVGGVEPYTFEWWNGLNTNPLAVGISPGDYFVSVIDGNGCEEDTSFVISTITSECIPNIFTPNGDNTNDTWSLEDTFLYEDSEVKIFGRFGKLIFQSVGYSKQWDGKNLQGENVPEGVYFYIIEVGNGFDQIKGTVTILR